MPERTRNLQMSIVGKPVQTRTSTQKISPSGRRCGSNRQENDKKMTRKICHVIMGLARSNSGLRSSSLGSSGDCRRSSLRAFEMTVTQFRWTPSRLGPSNPGPTLTSFVRGLRRPGRLAARVRASLWVGWNNVPLVGKSVLNLRRLHGRDLFVYIGAQQSTGGCISEGDIGESLH